MKNIIILSTFLLVLFIVTFLTSCDDFFSPTIEVFNESKLPNTIEQGYKQIKNNKVEIIKTTEQNK